MSKNELVSYIHALTGKSFKESRAICKAAKWNAKTAFMIATLGNADFERLNKIANATKDALVACLTPAVNYACETMREFAQALAQGFKDAGDNLPSGAIMQAIREENAAQTLESWTVETSADILNGNEIKQIFIDEIDEGGADNAGI